MKKAILEEGGKARVVDVPEPKARGNWAVVKVLVAPMCTEYKTFRAGRAGAFLGHEAAGEVVDVGPLCRVERGDRVVVMPTYPCGRCRLCVRGDYIHCQAMVDPAAFTGSPEGRATMAQFLVKPDWLLPRIPDGVPFEHGAMACCGLGPTFGACERMKVGAFDTVLITGMGPVGLGGVINSVTRGARAIAVEAHPWRAARAKELGAAAVLAPGPEALSQVMDLTDGTGVDAAIDCSGAVAAHRLCIDAVRRRGHVAFVGECGEETTFRASPDLIRKGIALLGSWHYNLNDVPDVMQVIGRAGDLLGRFITHTFPMTEIQDAFALQISGACAKVLLKPWG